MPGGGGGGGGGGITCVHHGQIEALAIRQARRLVQLAAQLRPQHFLPLLQGGLDAAMLLPQVLDFRQLLCPKPRLVLHRPHRAQRTAPSLASRLRLECTSVQEKARQQPLSCSAFWSSHQVPYIQ